MKLVGMEQTHKSKYLKNYELTYINKAGREKRYEIVSRNELAEPSDLGQKISGVSIVAFMDDKMLLLKEFRMGVNKEVYNLCAGMIEDGETIEDCISRELMEETGLSVKRYIDILKPCYSAVAISDIKTYIAFVEAEGLIGGKPSDNEDIKAHFYTKDEMKLLLNEEDFSARAQMAAYFFSRLSQTGLEEFIKNGYIN